MLSPMPVPLPGSLVVKYGSKMRRWLADNGREKHGKNAYDRAWFGVGDDEAVLKQYSGLRAYDNFYTELFEAPGSVD